MLDTLFLSVLDMTKAGSLVILAVLAARLLLRRVPKAVSYALWLVVLFRLLCPVGFQSPVSLMPEIKPMAQEYDLEDQAISFAGAGMAAYQAVGDVLNGGIDDQRVATDVKDDLGNTVYVSADMGDVWILFGSYVWAAGFCGLALYSGFSFLSLKRKLREAVPQEKGVFLAGGIDSPFVMGRKIYLPDGLADRERAYILAHERHHLRRGDPIWKALGFLALTIHWFNPLVWAAFVLGCRDMEMSCDEAVVKTFGPEIRGEYAASLLKIATGKRIIAGAPLAFGEGDPKGRILNLAKWKKPILIVSIIAAVLCLVLGVCLLTDPVRESKDGRSLFFGTLRYAEGRDLMLDGEDGRELLFQLSEGYDIPQGVEPGDTVMIRGTWQENRGVYVTSRVMATENTETASLEQAIEAAIIGAEGIGKEPEEFACASFWTLSKQSQGIVSELSGAKKVETVTVYGLALYHTYTCENGVLEQQSGSHIPVAITFRVTDGGEYVLTEYWMPRDGSYYAKDIRKKFPLGAVPDTQKYIDSQQAECLAKAKYYFGTTAPAVTTPEQGAFELAKVPGDGMTPLDSITPQYDWEFAAGEGAVILENGYAVANPEVWAGFTEKVALRLPARVRTVILNKGKVSMIRDILYDGNRFRAEIGLLEDGTLALVMQRDFEYLQTFRGNTETEAFLSCVLTNRELENPPQWLNTVFPTDTGAQLVYQQVTSLAVQPELPKQVIGARIMLEEQVLAELTDQTKLQSLMALLSKAEYVEKANSYDVFEPLALVLETGDGTVLRCPIGTQGDMIRIDGYFFDYGPGRVERDGESHFRNAILEMVRYFGLEDWPPALREYCIAKGIEPPRHSLKVIVGEELHD